MIPGSPHRPHQSHAVVKIVRGAVFKPRTQGGVDVYLSSSAVSGNELRNTLENIFPGPQQYSVQVGPV